MPIQLNKILTDIAVEKALYPNNTSVSAEEVEEAWSRVSKNNKLSVHETRSIFKVLQKKYEQEKQKNISSWKLFDVMDDMHRKEDNDQMMDEDEEFEMLEVQEDDENNGNQGGSDGDSSSKSSTSVATTPEKIEKIEKIVIPEKYKKMILPKCLPKNATQSAEDKKLLNMLVNPVRRNSIVNPVTQQLLQQQHHPQQQQPQRTNIKTTLMQHKGITLKRTQISPKGNHATYGVAEKKNETTTLQLPEAIKRKLNEDLSVTTTAANPPKKILKTNISSLNSGNSNHNANTASATTISASASTSTSTATSANKDAAASAALVVKEEPEDKYEPGTVITMPANGVVTVNSAETVAATAPSNGFSTCIEEIDFSKDIIFDAGATSVNSSNNKNIINNNTTNNEPTTIESGEIINMGNFDNALPPVFFKNLCNSSRHEAFGLYVANIMNRMSKSAAGKLEVQILRAVADIMSEDHTA